MSWVMESGDGFECRILVISMRCIVCFWSHFCFQNFGALRNDCFEFLQFDRMLFSFIVAEVEQKISSRKSWLTQCIMRRTFISHHFTSDELPQTQLRNQRQLWRSRLWRNLSHARISSFECLPLRPDSMATIFTYSRTSRQFDTNKRIDT